MIVHAATESLRAPCAPHTNAVVLETSEEGLETLCAVLRAACLPFSQVHEPDPPWCGQLMAVGVAPTAKADVYRHVSALPLLK